MIKWDKIADNSNARELKVLLCKEVKKLSKLTKTFFADYFNLDGHGPERVAFKMFKKDGEYMKDEDKFLRDYPKFTPDQTITLYYKDLGR